MAEETELDSTASPGTLDDWVHVNLSDIPPLPKDKNGKIMYKQLTMEQCLHTNLEPESSDEPNFDQPNISR